MVNTFSAEDIPVITPAFRLQWEQVQDCYVILYPEGMVKLSQSAGEILKRCDGKMSINNMIDDLHNQFPGANLEDDVYKFLEVAHANGWIKTKHAV